jgi:hypothetical protein
MIDRSFNLVTAAIAAAVFLLIAVVGSFVTARHMNVTADIHNMSAGRSGDAAPNVIQTRQDNKQDNKSAKGPATTGANPNNAVPPASK